MITIVAAVSKNGIIGSNNKLLWKLSDDLRRFKEITKNGVVVMGRKTYDSIGKPLPNRRNIILSRDTELIIDGCEVVNSIDKIEGDFFIIGGGEIYEKYIAICDKMYITLVDCIVDGDTKFPEIDNTWVKIKKENFKKDDRNEYDYSFIEYERYEF
jgi:dihydrofolate reductase